MNNQKFKFIELPRPEITLSPDGSAQILGGVVCSLQYTHCVSSKSSPCDTGALGNAFNPDMPCGSNPSGCGDGLLCAKFGLDCEPYHCSFCDVFSISN